MQFPIELGTITTSPLPSFEDVGLIPIDQTWSSPSAFGFWIALLSQPTSNGSFSHSYLRGNVNGPQSLLVKLSDALIALLSLYFADQSRLFLFAGSVGRPLWYWLS